MLARKEHNQTSWKEFIARNMNGRQYELDIRNFLAEATLDTTDLDSLNNCVNTYLDCRKIVVQSVPS